jgi:hypothetical protein
MRADPAEQMVERGARDDAGQAARALLGIAERLGGRIGDEAQRGRRPPPRCRNRTLALLYMGGAATTFALAAEGGGF